VRLVIGLTIDVNFPGTFSGYLFAASAMFCPDQVQENGTEKRQPAQRNLLFAMIADDLQRVATRRV
jgi:hypothetical protein